MFEVDFYTFSKKENSTARPSSATASYDCAMTSPSGILNPTIALNLGITANPRTFNYARIHIFDRYYFVKEWTFADGLWTASLAVDALASWKDTIGASSCYVLRSASEFNTDIMDTTYPATNNTTVIDQQQTSPWETDSLANGSFVVGIAGQSTTYYVFLPNALDLFLEYLFSDMYIDDLVGNWVSVFPQLKAQTNPLQFITSIQWMPFIAPGTEVSTIRVGFVDVPCVARKVSGSGVVAGALTFERLNHPQGVRGEYLANAPYSSYALFFPPWGIIPLDADIVANTFSIGVIWTVDLRTGRGTLNIVGGPGNTHYMSRIHSQVGVNYQVSQVLNTGFGLGNLIAPVMSTAASAYGGPAGLAAGAISNGVGAIGDFSASKIPSASTIGSAGGIDALRGIPTLQYEFKQIVSDDNAHRGRPLCANRQIGSLSGYILVKDADINLPCTQEEREVIRDYMEGGFFYE